MNLTKEDIARLQRNMARGYAAIRFTDRLEPLCDDWLEMHAKLEAIKQLVANLHWDCCCQELSGRTCLTCQFKEILG